MCVRRRMNPCNFNQVGYSFVAGKNVYLVGKSNVLEKQSSCKFVPVQNNLSKSFEHMCKVFSLVVSLLVFACAAEKCFVNALYTNNINVWIHNKMKRTSWWTFRFFAVWLLTASLYVSEIITGTLQIKNIHRITIQAS